MRHIAGLGVLSAVLLLGTACQGATLPGAYAKAPATRAGFGLFLEPGGETGRGLLLDKDAAMAAVLNAKARHRTPVGGGARSGTSGPCWLDEIDRLASERGISREHARVLYKNKKYKQPAETK